VATGILPAVEPGILPGGTDSAIVGRIEISCPDPGGKLPPSTSGTDA